MVQHNRKYYLFELGATDKVFQFLMQRRRPKTSASEADIVELLIRDIVKSQSTSNSTLSRVALAKERNLRV